MSGATRADRLRQAATVAAAVGQVVLPTLLPPRFAPGQEPPDVMQPAPATFAIWVPIFATSLVHATVQARPARRDDPTLRAIGWPTAAAYAATAVWAPLVATRRYWAAQTALLAVAGCAEVARRRLAAAEAGRTVPSGVRRAAVPPVAMLAAWGAAASAANLSAMLVAGKLVRPGRRAEAAGAALTAVTGGRRDAGGTQRPGRYPDRLRPGLPGHRRLGPRRHRGGTTAAFARRGRGCGHRPARGRRRSGHLGPPGPPRARTGWRRRCRRGKVDGVLMLLTPALREYRCAGPVIFRGGPPPRYEPPREAERVRFRRRIQRSLPGHVRFARVARHVRRPLRRRG